MSKCYFNGILLPSIPSEILTTYPAAVIIKNNSSSYYDLIVSEGHWRYNSNNNTLNNALTSTSYLYRISIQNSTEYVEWEFYKLSTNVYELDENKMIIWSRNTILNGDTIYFPRCAICEFSENKIKINDITLPPIPLETFTNNPYCFILFSNTSKRYYLYLSSARWYFNSNIVNTVTDATKYVYGILSTNTNDTWRSYTITKDIVIDGTTIIGVWSLQDIENTATNEIFLSATDAIEVPFMTKYLVRDNETIYTIADNTLVEIAGELNADLFINSGVDTIPNGDLIKNLTRPEVLCWTNKTEVQTLKATVKGVPKLPQSIISEKIDLMGGSIKGINSVTIESKGDVVFAVSFDNKETWKFFNGTTWQVAETEINGMNKEQFEAITETQYQTEYEQASCLYIRATLQNETQSLTSVKIDFIN